MEHCGHNIKISEIYISIFVHIKKMVILPTENRIVLKNAIN